MSSEESVEMVLDHSDVDEVVIFEQEKKDLDNLMFLRVLLVESDYSSRMIISALLRKCGYRVAAVSDGLKAWEILKGSPTNIDLILTEVELPSIAGFSLLNMIMEDDVCRRIPVIMMSSFDSVNLVFKCMRGGAADFLIKPLRKNELRNLWQHVWRRNSMYNGGKRSQNVSPVQEKVEDIDENCSTKCLTDDYMPLPKRHKGCSDKGSDAQSSCSKAEMEAESANVQSVQNLPHMKCRNASLTNVKSGEYVEVKDSETIEDNNDELESPRQAMDLIGAFDNHMEMYNTQSPQVFTKDGEVYFNPNDGGNKNRSTSMLELSLRRPDSGDHGEIQENNEKNTLNHSNASAFSWYANKTLQPPFVRLMDFQTETRECASITTDSPHRNALTLDNFSETMNFLVVDPPAEVKPACASPQHGVISVPIPVRGARVDSLHSCYAIPPPLFYTQSGPLPLQSSFSGSQQKPVCVSEDSNHDYQNAGFLNDHIAKKLSNETKHGELEKNLESSEDSRHGLPPSGQSATSSLCNSVVSHINSSECRSDCNGSNENFITGSIIGSRAGSGDKDVVFQEGTKGIVSHCFNPREAALNKFRLKRKDRCFEKKVRYQNRKRLAEQRPRVKGQFVRQIPS